MTKDTNQKIKDLLKKNLILPLELKHKILQYMSEMSFKDASELIEMLEENQVFQNTMHKKLIEHDPEVADQLKNILFKNETTELAAKS